VELSIYAEDSLNCYCLWKVSRAVQLRGNLYADSRVANESETIAAKALHRNEARREECDVGRARQRPFASAICRAISVMVGEQPGAGALGKHTVAAVDRIRAVRQHAG
jgi:hypothetical protein